MMFDNVISVCARSDLDTWVIASPRIVKFICSAKYTVIVPQEDLQLFRIASSSRYEVLSESLFTDDFLEELIKKVGISNSRLGWYLQQFLKLSALEMLSCGEAALIWDADTVPLKKLTFESGNDIGFYYGSEYHQPYFNAIQGFLGMAKVGNFSFISQCMPCRQKWAQSFFSTIEIRCGRTWQNAIIDCIDFSISAGFSEYESLGTFVMKEFPDEVKMLNRKWQRHGNGIIGSVNNLRYVSNLLALKYDFIAFEKWDPPFSLWKKNRLVRKYLSV